ncbi:hypothetical protein Hdeb2414_s0009g00325321 [Helianthus debilis subsp. tardiflorus]
MQPLSSSPRLLNHVSAYLHYACQQYLAKSLVPNIVERRQVSANFLRVEIPKLYTSTFSVITELNHSGAMYPGVPLILVITWL